MSSLNPKPVKPFPLVDPTLLDRKLCPLDAYGVSETVLQVSPQAHSDPTHGRQARPVSSTGTGHSPMNPNQHLKALVDRFMKEGAEDLWNEKDGPIVEPLPSVRPDGTTRSIAAPPLDLRKLISKGRDLAGKRDSVNLSNLGGNYVGSRNYSSQSRGRFRRNDSSSDDSDFDSDSESVQPFSNENSKFGRNVMRFGSSA